jgi:hypothetical protein
MIDATSVVDVVLPTPTYGSAHSEGATRHDLPTVTIEDLREHQTTLCANYAPLQSWLRLSISGEGKISCLDNSVSMFWSNSLWCHDTGTTLPFVIVINPIRTKPSALRSKRSFQRAGQIERRSPTTMPSIISDLVHQVQANSGLTLEEISPLLGVTRRSLQHWRKGDAISARKERRLRALVDALCMLPSEGAALRRNRLLERHPGGVRPYDLLAEGQFGAAHTLMTGDAETRLPDLIEGLKPSHPPVARLSILSDGPASVRGRLDVRRSARLKRQG